jgi:hypothetical protein
MRKIFVMLVTLLLLMTTSAFATGNDKTTKCCPAPTPTTINQGGKGGTGVGVGIGIGKGGNATIEKGAVTVKNQNKNVNKNVNTNVQGQFQNQIQDQKQTQNAVAVQGQSQGNNNTNDGNKQTTEITQTYEDKRDLINPIPVPMVDPKLTAARSGSIKTKGSLWTYLKSITDAEVSVMLSELFGAKADVSVRAIRDAGESTEIDLAAAPAGHYLATIYVVSTGADMIACEAVAIREALRLGGTRIVKSETDFKVTSEGSSVGVGIGGGASLFGHDDTIAIAPSGGFGWGSAKASNESLPQAMFTVYVDRARTTENKINQTVVEAPAPGTPTITLVDWLARN